MRGYTAVPEDGRTCLNLSLLWQISVLPPYWFTVSFDFVNVYMHTVLLLSCTRVHERIPTVDVESDAITYTPNDAAFYETWYFSSLISQTGKCFCYIHKTKHLAINVRCALSLIWKAIRTMHLGQQASVPSENVLAIISPARIILARPTWCVERKTITCLLTCRRDWVDLSAGGRGTRTCSTSSRRHSPVMHANPGEPPLTSRMTSRPA